jgi:hypothetical protein
MKTSLFTALLGLALLAGCESAPSLQSARTLDLPGTQSRTTVTVPADRVASRDDAPYALRGDGSVAPTPPTSPVTNYANQPAYPHGSTNGF